MLLHACGQSLREGCSVKRDKREVWQPSLCASVTRRKQLAGTTLPATIAAATSPSVVSATSPPMRPTTCHMASRAKHAPSSASSTTPRSAQRNSRQPDATSRRAPAPPPAPTSVTAAAVPARTRVPPKQRRPHHVRGGHVGRRGEHRLDGGYARVEEERRLLPPRTCACACSRCHVSHPAPTARAQAGPGRGRRGSNHD